MTTTEPTEAVVVREAQPMPVAAPSIWGSSEPQQILAKAADVATTLKDVVRKQGLLSVISGKEYPKCEAWTLLGTLLGVFPVLCWTRQVEGGWEARVEARTRDGSIVGAAEAQCLKAERNWANRDDFALRSMAQTRATAKCLRMPLGFVMTLGGFEPTPAEEMVADHPAKAAPAAAPAKPTEPKPFDPSKRLGGMLDRCAKHGQPADFIQRYFCDCGLLLPTESLGDLNPDWLPRSPAEMDALIQAAHVWGESGEAKRPYERPASANVPAKAPEDDQVPGAEAPAEREPWMDFPMPFGKHAGVKLHDLEKPYLFGLWANYTVETEYNGKPKRAETVAKDKTFRAMLDAAGVHYAFTKKD